MKRTKKGSSKRTIRSRVAHKRDGSGSHRARAPVGAGTPRAVRGSQAVRSRCGVFTKKICVLAALLAALIAAGVGLGAGFFIGQALNPGQSAPNQDTPAVIPGIVEEPDIPYIVTFIPPAELDVQASEADWENIDKAIRISLADTGHAKITLSILNVAYLKDTFKHLSLVYVVDNSAGQPFVGNTLIALTLEHPTDTALVNTMALAVGAIALDLIPEWTFDQLTFWVGKEDINDVVPIIVKVDVEYR